MDSDELNIFKDILVESLNPFGIKKSNPRVKAFLTHYEMLRQFNQVVNLTAMKKPSDIAFRLFADSLLPAEFINSLGELRILDIGPGGGFPSIPLRIFTGEKAHFTLVDSRKKVIFYLEELISRLSLSNIKTVIGRFESFQDNPAFIGSFDMVLNKAALKGEFFMSAVQVFLKPSGRALHWTKVDQMNKKPPDGWEIERVIEPPSDNSKYPGVVAVYKRF